MPSITARLFLRTTTTKAFFPCSMLLGGLWFAFAASGTAQPYTFTTIAGLAGVSGTADGTNSTARFYRPSGLAVDGAGNIYVADLLNHTIRKIAPAGTNWVVSTLAGLAGTLGSADGTNDQARFDHPSAVAVDNAGNLFVTDNYSQTIRKITPLGTNWVVSTVAGLAWAAGSDDGTNSDARFKGPQAIAVDSSGRLYVTDRLNCTVRGVSPVGTNWVVSTLAGTAVLNYGGFKDGRNGDAEFNLPFGIARHSGGNLYVADFGNNAIRRISPDGPDWVTSTVAGFSGAHGHQRRVRQACDVQLAEWHRGERFGDSLCDGPVQLHDQENRAGWQFLGGKHVGGLAGAAGTNDGVGVSARFYLPWGIAMDGEGSLFVADSFNNTIRRGMLPSASAPTLHILLVADAGGPFLVNYSEQLCAGDNPHTRLRSFLGGSD